MCISIHCSSQKAQSIGERSRICGSSHSPEQKITNLAELELIYMASRKLNKNRLIIGGLLLLTVIAFLLIHFFGNSSPRMTGDLNADNLTTEIMELESSIIEMELVFDQKDLELGQKERLLEEKYDEINILTQRLEELERQGKVDKAVIQQLRNQITEAKGKLLDTYKKEVDILVVDNSRLTRVVDSIYIVLDSTESMISTVVAQNAELNSQVQRCRDGEPVPVSLKQGLFAENIRFLIKKTGSDQYQPGPFKSSEIDNIRIEFDLVGYGSTPIGTRYLYLVVADRGGKVYEPTGTGGRWVYQGVDKAFSLRINSEYRGEKQSLSQIFQLGPGQKFTLGQNRLQIFVDDKMIGEATLFII